MSKPPRNIAVANRIQSCLAAPGPDPALHTDSVPPVHSHQPTENEGLVGQSVKGTGSVRGEAQNREIP